MHHNADLSLKAVALHMHQNFSRNVGETEQHLLRQILYAGTFVALCILVGVLNPKITWRYMWSISAILFSPKQSSFCANNF
jgi:hypothetical protein